MQELKHRAMALRSAAAQQTERESQLSDVHSEVHRLQARLELVVEQRTNAQAGAAAMQAQLECVGTHIEELQAQFDESRKVDPHRSAFRGLTATHSSSQLHTGPYRSTDLVPTW